MKETKTYDEKWGIINEEGEEEREQIQQWREKRQRVRGVRKKYRGFMVYSFNIDTLYSFFQNFNFMVLIQMVIAAIAVYLMQRYQIMFDVQVALFVSPIVFPLAFSINTDFQRREKVLEDLAIFKSSGMVWFFCMREWKQDAQLDNEWISAVHRKLKSMLFHLREYLLTSRIDRRMIILRAMYEDFSDTNQLIERVRVSKLPVNPALISRAIHLLNMMCLSFERLRVIREYRSPRSIRSFNKVFIMFLPILLSPYFVFLGKKSANEWEPYYIAVLVAFVFSALQGVQDKLDDPFDGMSEDDINLDTIDEWTFNSLEPTIKRTINIGRFTVKIQEDPNAVKVISAKQETTTPVNTPKSKKSSRMSFRKSLSNQSNEFDVCKDDAEPSYRKYAEMLEGMKGSSRITRLSMYKKPAIDFKEILPDTGDPLATIYEPQSSTTLSGSSNKSSDKEVKFALSNDCDTESPRHESYSLSSLSYKGSISRIPLIQDSPVPSISSESENRGGRTSSMVDSPSGCETSNRSLSFVISSDEETDDRGNSSPANDLNKTNVHFIIPSANKNDLNESKANAINDEGHTSAIDNSSNLPTSQRIVGNVDVSENSSNETPHRQHKTDSSFVQNSNYESHAPKAKSHKFYISNVNVDNCGENTVPIHPGEERNNDCNIVNRENELFGSPPNVKASSESCGGNGDPLSSDSKTLKDVDDFSYSSPMLKKYDDPSIPLVNNDDHPNKYHVVTIDHEFSPSKQCSLDNQKGSIEPKRKIGVIKPNKVHCSP